MNGMEWTGRCQFHSEQMDLAIRRVDETRDNRRNTTFELCM
jgi:hypothetical protein